MHRGVGEFRKTAGGRLGDSCIRQHPEALRTGLEGAHAVGNENVRDDASEGNGAWIGDVGCGKKQLSAERAELNYGEILCGKEPADPVSTSINSTKRTAPRNCDSGIAPDTRTGQMLIGGHELLNCNCGDAVQIGGSKSNVAVAREELTSIETGVKR